MQAAERDLVVAVVQQHADSLLRVARRYTSCAADAEDAYQRALEIFVKNAHRLEAGGAHRWLHVVVRNEALAVRRSRSSLVGVPDEGALDALDDARHVPSVEERSERFDELSRAAEALQRLKPQEVTALWLKAEGLSYDEIAERQGWTYTKVNRCITEGRRAFLRRYAGIEAGEECEKWADVLAAMADGEATAQQTLDARPHLRNCPSCRASLAAMHTGGRAVAALLPPVGVLVDPSGPTSLVARLGEVAASVHERAVGVALKAQAAADALATGKLAAVAASTAALAGGGLAADRHFGEDSARANPARANPAPPTRVVEASTAAASQSAPASPEPSGRTRRTAAVARSGDAIPTPRRSARRRERAPAAAAFAPEAEPAPQPTTGPAPKAAGATTPPPKTAPDAEFDLVAPARP